MEHDLTGHCLCGAVRFRARSSDDVLRAGHCGQCRRWAGHVWAAVGVRDLTVEGPVRWFASSDAAERAELHTHAEEDGVMRMGPIEGGITGDAGEAHQLARGGDHVMLLGLTRPLADGDSIELSFDFGNCGTETATATVDNQREDTGATGHGDHSGH